MAKKVIIDCDPGIDDAVALTMALFDPRLEVLAITAAAGNVNAHQASRNVQTILELLDPPKWPRLGAAIDSEQTTQTNAKHIHGEDGLGNISIEVSELHRQHPSDKLIIDEVHNAPGEVTIVSLGPLTNVASALNRDPGLATMVNRIIMTGGSVAGIGNISACAEFNMYCDPQAARTVFRSALTKTLIPLDVTKRISMGFDFMNEIPSDESRAGSLLRRILPYLFRSYHQFYGQEGIHIHDAVSLIAAVDPEYFTMEEMSGDVEVSGELTCGATIFDRRSRSESRNNMEVACDINVTAVEDAIGNCLKFAGQGSR